MGACGYLRQGPLFCSEEALERPCFWVGVTRPTQGSPWPKPQGDLERARRVPR